MITTGTLCKMKNTGTNNSIEELSSRERTTSRENSQYGQSVKSSNVDNHLLIRVQNYDEKQKNQFYVKKSSIKIPNLVNQAAG